VRSRRPTALFAGSSRRRTRRFCCALSSLLCVCWTAARHCCCVRINAARRRCAEAAQRARPVARAAGKEHRQARVASCDGGQAKEECVFCVRPLARHHSRRKRRRVLSCRLLSCRLLSCPLMSLRATSCMCMLCDAVERDAARREAEERKERERIEARARRKAELAVCSGAEPESSLSLSHRPLRCRLHLVPSPLSRHRVSSSALLRCLC
jgi:hypothetical protein